MKPFFAISQKNLQMLFLALGLAYLHRHGYGQDIRIEVPRTEIAIDEFLQIKVSVVGEKISSHSAFPSIRGFAKAEISSGEQQVILNGKLVQVTHLAQSYRPQREGTHNIPPFSMTINGKQVQFEGMTIQVTKVAAARNFWTAPDLEPDVTVPREDVFLHVSASGKEVYVGEGVNVAISFYALQNSPFLLRFPDDLAQKLAAAVKKLKPENSWEENFNIGGQIMPEFVKINGKEYQRYKIYQATYYIPTAGEVELPAITLPLVRIRPGNYGREEVRNYASKPLKIKVKPLPPHPLVEKIAVGRFKLEEKISKPHLQTGQSTSFEFQITGEGNVAFLREPDIRHTPHLEIYPPNVQQQIQHAYDRVTGSKKFTYLIIPKEPGTYPLANFFQWIFFNLDKSNYDTLKPKTILQAEGESLADKAIDNISGSAFYDYLYTMDNQLYRLDSADWWKTALTFLLGISALVTMVLAVVNLKRR
ncbi:MAG: BatD family protein [Cytophagales bacterium]|nr:BatD family protein [Bernardetiaceae bacterium]MDW8211745.1 BatD family protein [Cytophagales bacterium]